MTIMPQLAPPKEELTWGGPQDLSAWEALMWRAEPDPRTSSTGILLEILDGAPEWDRFVADVTNTVDRVPRLRERIVEPVVPVVQPAWSAVPGFDVAEHLHHVELSGEATDTDVLDLCNTTMRRPLDRTGPPWEMTLVTGLADGRAAVLFRFHHSLSDGLGLIQLLAIAHSTTADGDAAGDPVATRALRAVVTPTELLHTRLRERVWSTTRSTLSQLRQPVLDRITKTPGTLREARDFTQSLVRMLGGTSAPGSPLLAERKPGSRFLTIDVDLVELQQAARARGGSLNDAFVASILGGVRRYHEAHGTMVDAVPLAMPVSLRSANDAMGGNRFAGIRLPGPVAESDPDERIRIVREQVLAARDEPALAFLDHIAPVLTRLPAAAIIELMATLTTSSDVQVSNIRGLGHPVYLAGQRVLRTYPLGPRPGVAAMIAMITYDGVCCLGINADPAAIPDPEDFRRCLIEGFAEVIDVDAPKEAGA
jgi:WS/DGAT/MGAT family acyltransferase